MSYKFIQFGVSHAVLTVGQSLPVSEQDGELGLPAA